MASKSKDELDRWGDRMRVQCMVCGEWQEPTGRTGRENLRGPKMFAGDTCSKECARALRGSLPRRPVQVYVKRK